MDRNFYITAALVAAPFLGLMGFNLWSDPLADQREWMSGQLAAIAMQRNAEDIEEAEQPAWLESIGGRPSAWATITTPPPPAAPPPPPEAKAPEAPNLKEKLQGVRITRSQLGNKKVKIITPESERGTWFSIGDRINNCTLIEFSKTTATFAFEWKEGGRTLSITLPRE